LDKTVAVDFDDEFPLLINKQTHKIDYLRTTTEQMMAEYVLVGFNTQVIVVLFSGLHQL
jgi:hypothetical protein